ncbi:MAG TPA: hypothetical protein V6D20_19705, partial [Candidatus Obscuribacterales bacterium]
LLHGPLILDSGPQLPRLLVLVLPQLTLQNQNQTLRVVALVLVFLPIRSPPWTVISGIEIASLTETEMFIPGIVMFIPGIERGTEIVFILVIAWWDRLPLLPIPNLLEPANHLNLLGMLTMNRLYRA